MRTILILAAVLVAVPIVFTVAKRVLAMGLARLFARAIGAAALAQQADRIHLIPCDPDAWADTRAAGSLAAPLVTRGFEDAGSYRIDEMPGVLVRLLAKPADSFYAAIYEHPQVGHWLDLACRYEDGTGATFTTSRPTGLAPRPGHPVVNAPEASPAALYERACADRPAGTLRATSSFFAQRDFEEAYAESMAWRKERGVTAAEVVEVAARMEPGDQAERVA